MRAAGAVWRARYRQNALVASEVAGERGLCVGAVLGDIQVARDGDPVGIEMPAAPDGFRLEQRDALADEIDIGELVEDEIAAALGDAADRRGAAGRHPDRRMRLLLRWRLDHDIVELPIAAAMRESLCRGPCLGD